MVRLERAGFLDADIGRLIGAQLGVTVTAIWHGREAKIAPLPSEVIAPGDILLEVNGSSVTDSSSMLNLISSLKPGHNATVKIARNQQEHKLSILIGKRPRLDPRRN